MRSRAMVVLGILAGPMMIPACVKRAPRNVATSCAVPGLDRLPHRPLIALYGVDPWLHVIGSDVPHITVYEDGLVIGFQPREHERAERWIARVDPSNVETLLEKVEATGIGELPRWDDVCEGVTDMPVTSILYRSGHRWRSVSVRGMNDDGYCVFSDGATDRHPDRAPAAFMEAYALLKKFRPDGATPWRPDTIEMMLADSDSDADPLPWPNGVPAPPPNAIAPKGDIPGIYHHFVPGIHEERLRDFLKARAPSQPVEVHGRKWSFGLRVALPEEDYLRRGWDAARCEASRETP